MEKCPDREKIALLASGDLPEQQAHRILEHIETCDKCRRIAEQFEKLEYLLGCAETDEEGEISLSDPGPSETFQRELMENVTRKLQEEEARKSRFRPLFEDIVEEVYGLSPEPTLPGYAATRPEKEAPGQKDRMFQDLVCLLDMLLAADISPEKRLMRIKKAIEAVRCEEDNDASPGGGKEGDAAPQ